MNVKPSKDLMAFIKKLAPEQRQLIRRTLTAAEKGLISPQNLQEPLARFYKVKAGRFRIICAIEANTIFALVAERRSVVYQMATIELLQEILRGERS